MEKKKKVGKGKDNIMKNWQIMGIKKERWWGWKLFSSSLQITPAGGKTQQ